MEKFLLVLIGCVALAISPAAGEVPMANVFARQTTSLNGPWQVIVDPYDTGFFDSQNHPFDEAATISGGFALDHLAADMSELVEYNFNTSPVLKVPGDWNSQNDKLFYYEGSVWYRTKFDLTTNAPEHRQFVYFGAANYEAEVYLNGKKLGQHIGGFTPFAYEITEAAKPTDNSLVVRVNNRRHQSGVPGITTDWWNYGGLTREVLLVDEPATFIANYLVQLKPGTTNVIAARVQLNGPNKEKVVRIYFPSLGLATEIMADHEGLAQIEIPAINLTLWSPEHPVLNNVEITAGQDDVHDRVGFRTIATEGDEIRLNGRKIFLRGISLHEENPLQGGRAWSEADARQLLGWAKELGCNFMRLADYPHNEHMARIADEMGLMCEEEIPVFGPLQWTNAETLANAKKQLADLIARDQNRASVVIWSVSGETPPGDAGTKFLKSLAAAAQAQDATRLISATVGIRTNPSDWAHNIVDDPYGEATDLCSFNEYTGWSDGLPEKIDHLTWSISGGKPVIVCEFGADARADFHADGQTRFSEEYQADVYRRTLQMLEKIPGFSGCTPLALCDFRSPRRLLPGIQDGWDIKGVIGRQGEKKLAFGVLKDYYAAKEKADIVK